jgi:hypothetical protein
MPLAHWRCSDCGATGVGNSAASFAEDETDHMLTGCNGTLRWEREWSPEVGSRPRRLVTNPKPPRVRIVRG